MEDIVKIVVLGDTGVGKTSFITRFVHGSAGGVNGNTIRSSQYDPDVVVKEVEIEGRVVKAYIHDCPRRDSAFSSHSMTAPNFYRNVDVVILVYSVDDQNSLEALQDCWVTEFATYSDVSDTNWIIVGNKNDLRLEIDQETLKEISFRLQGSVSIFASAKTGKNVQEAFHIAVKKGLETRKKKEGTINLKERNKTKTPRQSGSGGGCKC